MKTFSPEEKDLIQRQIEKATGLKFNGPKPECFVSAQAGCVKAQTTTLASRTMVMFQVYTTYLGPDGLFHFHWMEEFCLN